MLQQDEKFGEIESIKAVSELYAPVGGEVIAVNDSLETAPEVVNADPYAAGWMVKIQVNAPAQADALLDLAAYEALIGE